MKLTARVLAVFFVVPALGVASSDSSQTAPPEKGLGSFLSSFFGGSQNSQEESSEAEDDSAPYGLEEGASNLLSPEELLGEDLLKKALPWRPPQYSEQKGALGWSPDVFSVPKGLEGRVQFWKDIYTKYTSDQGVLHDRYYYGVVYETIDFGPIMNDQTKTARQKAIAREKLVEERRQQLSVRLKNLSQTKSPIGLTIEDMRLWHLFEKIGDPHKFENASNPKRIRFQLGQKDRFLVGIYHSGRYLKEMEKAFEEERLPIELTRLPFVESSFNINARSKVGASGIWQFMRRTAKPFLKLNREVDERNDPLKATRASARLLRQNYQMLGAWPLAITAYNHGASGLRRIVEKMGSRDIVEIVNRYSSRTFGFASENFYACFLAALEVEREAKKYFADPKWAPEAEEVEVRLRKPMKFSLLLSFYDGDRKLAELANPHLLARVRQGKSPIPVGNFIRVPKARVELAESFQRGKINMAKLEAELKKEGISAQATARPEGAQLVPVKYEEPGGQPAIPSVEGR